MACSEKQVMVVGIDDSEHSSYALGWTLDHFFVPCASNPTFKLVVVHAKPTPTSAVGLAGPGNCYPPITYTFFFLLHTCVCWTTGVELSRKMDDLISGNSLAYVGIVGAAEVLPMVDADLKKIAARVVEKAKELCISKSVLLLLLFF
jgi:hypothetical protein